MRIPDYHIHTNYSPDSTMTQEEAVQAAIKAGITDSSLKDFYDCVGHIGYIAKCNHYEDNTFLYDLFPEMFDEILSIIIKNGKGIELNVSGLKRAGHVLPHPSIVSRYYEMGGRIITIGSDAHRPEDIGFNMKKAIKIIKDCGFNEIAIFNKRNPFFEPIV